MEPNLTEGYGDRIKRALTHGPRPMSIRQLGAEMERKYPDIRGATYGSVRQYAAGNIGSPRVELLRAIADVLGVRQEWVAFADGPMTETEAAAHQAAEASGPGLQDVLWTHFTEGCGFDAPSFLRALIPYLWLDTPAMGSRQQELAVARQLGTMLMAPLRAIDVDPEELSWGELRSYVLAMIPGIRAAGDHIPSTDEEETNE